MKCHVPSTLLLPRTDTAVAACLHLIILCKNPIIFFICPSYFSVTFLTFGSCIFLRIGVCEVKILKPVVLLLLPRRRDFPALPFKEEVKDSKQKQRARKRIVEDLRVV